MTQPTSLRQLPPNSLIILGGAALMLSLSMGMRQSMGLFMGPVTRDLGLSAADYTLAIAIQNIMWGIAQPLMGGLADRFGVRPVAVGGVLLYAGGLMLTAAASSIWHLHLGAGIMIGVALACTGSSICMSASARVVSPTARSLVLGIVSAAGSLGTFVAAPLAQTLISSHGWVFALFGFVALCAVMMAGAWTGGGGGAARRAAEPGLGVREALAEAAAHRGYVVMAAAFFVCGLQLVFLTTHLPTYLALCGMDPMLGAQALAVVGGFNVFGSYAIGWLGGRYPKHVLLGLVYLLRSASLAIFFLMPPSTASTLIFAAAMGTLWLGVIPLINGLVADLFGMRHMAMLTGIAFFSHQIGSFIGAWGGGVIFDMLGSYDRAWQAGVAIGLIAGTAQLFMDNRPTPRMAAAAASIG